MEPCDVSDHFMASFDTVHTQMTAKCMTVKPKQSRGVVWGVGEVAVQVREREQFTQFILTHQKVI